MAVPNLPFWLSAANTEFSANGWGSNILSKAGLGMTGLLGQLAGMASINYWYRRTNEAVRLR